MTPLHGRLMEWERPPFRLPIGRSHMVAYWDRCRIVDPCGCFPSIPYAMPRVARTRTMEYSGTLKMLVAVLLEAVAWVVRGQKLVSLDCAPVAAVLEGRHRNRLAENQM